MFRKTNTRRHRHTLHDDQNEKLYCNIIIVIVIGTSVGVCGSGSPVIASSWCQCLNKEFVCVCLLVRVCLQLGDTPIRWFKALIRPSEDTSSIDGGRGEGWVAPDPLPSKKRAEADIYVLESFSVNVFPFELKCEHQHLLLSVFLSNSYIAPVAPCRRPLGLHPALLLLLLRLLLLLPSLNPSLLSSLWSMLHKGTWKGLRWPGSAKEAPKIDCWTSQRVQGTGPDLATCHPTGQRGTYGTSGHGYHLPFIFSLGR